MKTKVSIEQARKKNWCLIGYDQYKRPRYACGTCFMHSFVRAKNTEIPEYCPRCGAELGFAS